MLGQKRNDSLFGPGSRTIEAPQSVLEKQEAALEGSPLDEAVQPPFETQPRRQHSPMQMTCPGVLLPRKQLLARGPLPVLHTGE